MIEFSLIICVYEKEDPQFLSQCLDSVLAQTRQPDELIIVKDGPLTGGLEKVINDFPFPNGKKVISLPENKTQGPARAEGVKAAKHDYIAIMDSDDICRPHRFEKQLKMIADNPELGLIGGQISEFADDPGYKVAERHVPTAHSEIVKFLKKRNPFNSMTVMFNRKLVLEAGNYRYFPWFEDYDLWARMISNGAICANTSDVLVDARVGSGMYARRRGVSYIRAEWRMQKHLKKSGIINTAGFIRNVALRIPIRLLPEKALARVYNRFARRR